MVIKSKSEWGLYSIYSYSGLGTVLYVILVSPIMNQFSYSLLFLIPLSNSPSLFPFSASRTPLPFVHTAVALLQCQLKVS